MSASLAFVRGIHRGPVNSPHRGPVTRKMFSFDDVIIAWITWLRARWLIDAQAIINQNKANLRRIKSPLNNMFNSSRDKSFFTSIKILGWIYLSIPKFQRCSSSSWSLGMDIFEVKLTVRGQQHSFSTHERVFLWKCQSFWDRKCLDLRGARTPNLRMPNALTYWAIRARHLLSHVLNIGSGGIDIFEVKLTFGYVTSSTFYWAYDYLSIKCIYVS